MDSDPRTRRRVLQLTGAGLASGLAGCIFGGPEDPTPPQPGTTPPDTPTASPTPSPTPTCPGAPGFQVTPTKEGLDGTEYPAYPEDLTEASAREFVIAYEAAYRHNEMLSKYYIEGTVDIDVETSIDLFEPRGDGFAMGALSHVTTYLRTETPTPTSTPKPWIDLDFAAWYWCRPEEARRHETDPPNLEAPIPELGSADQIVC